jgi:hypothetical protein
MLFNSESKGLLNQVTDKLREIDPTVWIRAAIAEAPPQGLIVVDSMRFGDDYTFLRSEGYSLWRVDSALAIRTHRLTRRGQLFNPAVDDVHPAESELDGEGFDVRIDNTHHDAEELVAIVDHELESICRRQARRALSQEPWPTSS